MEMQEMNLTEEKTQEEKKEKEERKGEDYRLLEDSAHPTEEKVEAEYTDLKFPDEDIYSQSHVPHASVKSLKDLQRRARLYLRLCVILSVVSFILLIAVIFLGATRQSQTVCHDETRIERVTAPKSRSVPCTWQECRQVCSGKRTPALPCIKCDAGWREFEGSCFYFSRKLYTWGASREECTKMGGDLAIPDNERLEEYLIMKGNMAYWIGVIQIKTGEPVWVNATVEESFLSQSQIEGNCGYLVGGDNHGWRLSPCSRETAFICQK